MGQAKKSFYPNEEIEHFLETIPKGQLSGRINDLILKGLTFEHQTKVREDYIRFNDLIAKDIPRAKAKSGFSTTMMMSAKAFEAEDEVEDFF